MTNKLNELIAKYASELAKWNVETDEFTELLDDDFNVYDACGGNTNDAYDLGESHSEAFTSANLISEFIRELTEITKEDDE